MQAFDGTKIRVAPNHALLDCFDVYYDGVLAGLVIKESAGRYVASVMVACARGGTLETCGTAESQEVAATLVAQAFLHHDRLKG